MAQRWPAPKPKLAQAEFDEAVKSNMEDFDMEPEEAVKSAEEEFKLQGYDITGVFKQAGGTNMEEQPLAKATQALEAELTAAESSGSPAMGAISSALDALFQALNEDESKMQEILAVALKVHTLKTVLAVVDLLSRQSASGTLISALGISQQLMQGSLEVRDCFDDLKGHELVMRLLEQYPSDTAVLIAITAVGEAAALKEEQNKEMLTKFGFGEALVGILRSIDSSADSAVPSPALIINTCGALRSLVTADDERPTGSCAFKNARALAGKHQALKVLLHVLRRVSTVSTELCNAVLLTVKALAANEDICKEFADDGGIATMLDILKRWMQCREVVRCCTQALRQLSIADPVKKLLAANEGLEVILALLSTWAETEDVLEPSLGVLGNMMLRLPEVVVQAAEAGTIEVLLTLMAAQPNMGSVQRQLCIAVRNMVVRTTEYREAFLSQGAEEMIREAKVKHPNTCKDVGYAALRDLGLNNYND